MEWISVEKELPVLGQYVIGTDGHHVGECIYAGEKFLPCNHFHVPSWVEITYWMPLPHPPLY